MSNNISNIGGSNPVGFNPKGKPEQEAEETTFESTTCSCDQTDLECDPLCSIGKSMVQPKKPYNFDSRDVEDDTATYMRFIEFAHGIKEGLMLNGVSEEEAARRSLIAAEALFGTI